MRDVQDRELELRAQLVEQVEDLEADRDVEHRDRLVGQQHPRPRGERARDRDTLALAAGQLVREPARELLVGVSRTRSSRRPTSAAIAALPFTCWCSAPAG